jgi:hypothetical protein
MKYKISNMILNAMFLNFKHNIILNKKKCAVEGALFESDLIDMIISVGSVKNESIFSIKEYTDTVFNKIKRLSSIYEIEPHGIYFDNPITIRFKKIKSMFRENIYLIKHQMDNEYFDIAAIYTPSKTEQSSEQELTIEFELKKFSTIFLGDFQTPLILNVNQISGNDMFIEPGLNVLKSCSFGNCNGYLIENLKFQGVTNNFVFNRNHCPVVNCNRNMLEKMIFYKSKAKIEFKREESEVEYETSIETDGDEIIIVGYKDHITEYSNLKISLTPKFELNQLNHRMGISFIELKSIFEINLMFLVLEHSSNFFF